MAKASNKTAAAPAPADAAPTSRGEMVDIVAAQTNLTKTQAEGAIRAFESAIMRTLSGGGEVRLNGFGSFKVTHRAARVGRNPRTGEPADVAARSVPRFVPSAAFKASVDSEVGGGAKKAPAKAKK